jgi:hypothetical protein
MKYPYYIVQSWTGRLPVPVQYRRTPIAKMFETGKIGGSKMREQTFATLQKAQQAAFQAQRESQRVEVLMVPKPNHCRVMCRNWRQRNCSQSPVTPE